MRPKAFFGSLYRCLARGARSVLQLYAENMDQSEMIMTYAMRAGFAGGIVVDWPHSSKARKAYLILTCGPPSMQTSLPKGKGEDGEMCSEEESDDDEHQTVGIYDRDQPWKKLKTNKKGKGREWVLQKKEQTRRKGHAVPPDTKYTARKRKAHF
ncbi:Methyltransferase involved in Williams-Beuren syndrome [Musa troglodytarum]|uniref:Methyltransferase involved in Williams-Beuren syndrome n=1 Tax=Musa troglodytarum TaxID=320322 RepID=A0A9E7K936_9LILI|nr:Methyltransferase involved in Williams-Beuren syndrome [Musa troglodytarum]